MDEAEVLFSVILHPERPTPDIDPCDVHIGPLRPADLRNDNLLSLEHGHALFRIESVLSLQLTIKVRRQVRGAEYLLVKIKCFVKDRENQVAIAARTILSAYAFLYGI